MVPANFNQLYYFWAVSRSRSLTAAASSLLMTQSNLSHQMGRLEAALGRRLMARSRKGVTLTAEGLALSGVCARMFEPASEYLNALRAGREALPPPLRLVCARTVSRHDVLSTAEFLRSRRPQVSLRIHAGTNEEAAARLRDGLADAAISDADLAARLGRDFHSTLIRRRPFFFTAAAAMARSARRFPECLQTLPLLLRPSDHPVRKQVDAFLSRKGLAPVIAVESDDPELILALAQRGEGVCILDPKDIAREIARGQMALLHRETVGIISEVRLISARRPPSHPALRGAIEALMLRPA